MGFEVLVPLLAIFSVLLVPILGLTVILTTRFALKPLAETLAKALRESGQGSSAEGRLHLQDLAEQVQALTEEVQRLREAQDFDRSLLAARSGEGKPSG
jgi:hypothetical protein